MTQQTERRILKKIVVVSHTHWDREWYEDFQNYRTRLVYFMDELLDHLKADASYRHFMLDGQTVVLGDYTAIRPERQEELKAYLQEGRLAAGPWYVMPDEFLVSGESLVRNLLTGFRQSRAMGAEPMKSGYVTDIFGHNSQMPQIFSGFGIDNAVLFRGFHGDGDPSELWWEGADGSRVLALKLDEDRAYSDFYFFLRWPFVERDFQYDEEELLRRAKEMIAYKTERITTDIALGLDGCDHVEIEPRLGWMLELLNNMDAGVEWVHSSLEEYLNELRGKVGGIEVLRGEQRIPGYNGVNNMVLSNVLSSRIHLKQLNQSGEYLLTGWAEPWSAFAEHDGRAYPKPFLGEAWRHLLENHPHDSICGCSITPVHEDMLYRFAQSRSIGERMTGEALAFISGHIDESALQGRHAAILFNSSQRSVNGVIHFELELPAGTTNPSQFPEVAGTNFKLLDHEGREVPFQIVGLQKNSIKRWRPYRDIPRGRAVDRYTIALSADIPAFGYTAYTVEMHLSEAPGAGEYAFRKAAEPVRYPGAQQTSPTSWENGRVRIDIAANGTLALRDLTTGYETSGLLTFEDEADIGDGWKFIAPVSNETVNSAAGPASVSVMYDGPLETCLRIALRLDVPESAAADQTRRSAVRTSLPITTFVTLRKDDPIIRCRTVVDNHVRDHRLRVLLPTGIDSGEFTTSTPFDLVRRNVVKPDYSRHIEKDSGIVPYNGLLSIDNGQHGLAIFSKGLYEVQVREDRARTAGLTLFRSTRSEVLSDGGDGGNLLQTLEFEYAFRPFDPAAVSGGDLMIEKLQVALDIRSINRPVGRVAHETLHRRPADLPARRSYLDIQGSGLVVSSYKQAEDDADAWIVRLWNCLETAETGEIRPLAQVSRAERVNLDEQTLELLEAGVDNKWTVTVQPKEIVTLKFWYSS
ncbi:alpha-mannosidase [Paenibacillus mendelii]|uniref:Alpha-mannosidase n=1 Tax=Paenibacillus mendelii TaxID=206163 RepID=A0ABV6J2Z0_9BACL|nr:glycoside hydrolase family 38 C-terminal domain-containing protein [Paenibacillus mendelii]MCQ6559362.1 glycosyl hydrolase-related protein [Paenibacillus mendelii]